MFEAAFATIQPNFPPGILQGNLRYCNTYYNMSSGMDATGLWNQGVSSQLGETWQYVEDPLQEVMNTKGLVNLKLKGTDRTEKSVKEINQKLSKLRSEEIKSVTQQIDMQWSSYDKTGGIINEL
jgi:Mn-containing catalase